MLLLLLRSHTSPTLLLLRMLRMLHVYRFVSQQEEGPMFPLPVRLMMRVQSMAPMVQRMMSWMMSWMMHGEDKKVKAGKSLADINKVSVCVSRGERETDPTTPCRRHGVVLCVFRPTCAGVLSPIRCSTRILV